jgi:hypothetical protein
VNVSFGEKSPPSGYGRELPHQQWSQDGPDLSLNADACHRARDASRRRTRRLVNIRPR